MMFQRWIWLPSVLVLCLLAVACENEETPAGTVSPGPATPAKLAFAYNPTGEETSLADGATMPNYEIYLVDADGSNLTRLTNDPGSDLSPAWSPDGKRIAFVRQSVEDIESGKTFIYVMNADGTGQTRLAEGLSPFWSPDGERIAFLGQHEQNTEVWNLDVYVMTAEGADQTNLTKSDAQEYFRSVGGAIGSANPWSPDGKRLAFNRATFEPGEEEGQTEGTIQVFVMNADGSGQKLLTDKQGVFVGWSPDGKRLLYAMGSEEEGFRLYVIGADGSGEKLILELPGQNPQGFPVWSPDGARIAYTADRGGNDAIYIMNADGSGATLVTSGAGDGCDGLYGTSWSPDGEQLAFARGCFDGDAEVWVVNADSTGERHVAGTAGAQPTRAALNPVWSPQLPPEEEPAPPKLTADNLPSLVLTDEELGDVYSGIALRNESPYSNQEFIDGASDSGSTPEEAQSEIDKYGRVAGYVASYGSPDGVEAVLISLTLHESAEGASAALRDAWDGFVRLTARADTEDLDLSDLADEAQGLFIRTPDRGVSVMLHLRVDNVRAVVSITPAADDDPRPEARQLADKLAEKMEAVIEG